MRSRTTKILDWLVFPVGVLIFSVGMFTISFGTSILIPYKYRIFELVLIAAFICYLKRDDF